MNIDQESLRMSLQYLDKIGEKIGTTADTIWPWLVQQQYVYLGTSASIFGVGCILLLIALHISKKYHPFDDIKYGTEEVDLQRILRCGTIIASVFATVIGLLATIVNLPKLFNPQYYALKDLFELIK